MSLQLCSYMYFVLFLLVFFAPSSTNIDSLQVVSLMAPNKLEFTHVGVQSLSARLVIGSDDEHDPEYVPTGTATTARAAHATRSMPKKVESGVVTASLSDEERTLTGTPSGTATQEELLSGSLGVLWPEEASRSQKSLHPQRLQSLPRLMRLTV